MSTTSANDSRIKPTLPWTRRLLYLASLLVVSVGISLYFLTESTDTYFSWTIQVPLTAAFIGAGYLASCLLEFLSARDTVWARSRIAVPAVVIFSVLMFIATVLHLDKFHFNAPNPLTVAGTWVWFLVYAIVPVLLAITWWQQIRAPGADPVQVAPLPAWLRGLMGLHCLVLVILGVIGMIAPPVLVSLWPWELTPLTARATGAWCVGLGIASGHVAYENDLARSFPALLSLGIFGLLALIALARYPSAGGLDWSGVKIWAYVLLVASMLVAGAYGAFAARRFATEQSAG